MDMNEELNDEVDEESEIPEESAQEDKTEGKDETAEQIRNLEKMFTNAIRDLNDGINNAANWIRKTLDDKVEAARAVAARQKEDDPFVKIEKLSHLRDIGAITLEEFNSKKAELLKKI